MRRIIPVSVILILLMVACSGRPDKVIPRDRLEDVLCDVYKGEAMIDLSFGRYREDSARARVRESVYRKYGITQEEFDSTLSYYGRHIDEYVELHDDIITRLENESRMMGRSKGDAHIGGDSVNVWQEYARYILTGKTAEKFLRFSLARDENWEAGDNYTWQFKLFNRSSKVNIGVCIDYEDGSTDILNSVADKDGWNRVTINMDTTRTPVAIYGYASVDLKPEEMIFIDSLSLVRKRYDDYYYRRRYNSRKFVYGADQIRNDRSKANITSPQQLSLRKPGI